MSTAIDGRVPGGAMARGLPDFLTAPPAHHAGCPPPAFTPEAGRPITDTPTPGMS